MAFKGLDVQAEGGPVAFRPLFIPEECEKELSTDLIDTLDEIDESGGFAVLLTCDDCNMYSVAEWSKMQLRAHLTEDQLSRLVFLVVAIPAETVDNFIPAKAWSLSPGKFPVVLVDKSTGSALSDRLANHGTFTASLNLKQVLEQRPCRDSQAETGPSAGVGEEQKRDQKQAGHHGFFNRALSISRGAPERLPGT